MEAASATAIAAVSSSVKPSSEQSQESAESNDVVEARSVEAADQRQAAIATATNSTSFGAA